MMGKKTQQRIKSLRCIIQLHSNALVAMVLLVFCVVEAANLNVFLKIVFPPAAHDVPGRCMCHTKIKFIKGNMSDFQVLEKRPGCDRTELM